ncbi:hypothetical protein GQ473_04680 [archaeon]|nr:hypothetical protein [archaeon]
MITVDTREKLPWSVYWPDNTYVVATLSTGDYSNGNILIERKSITDLCNSLGKGKKRFYREIERGFDFLIIEGCKADITTHLKYVNSRMTSQYIMHCLKEIYEDYGIQIIFADDRENAAEIALHILIDYNISPNCL